MSKSSFYSGSGLTNTEQDAIEGAKNAAEAARDAAQAAQTAAETARDSAQSSSSTASGHAATATTKADEASGSANIANTHASTATTKASEASTSASNASDDADDAQKLAINAEDSQFTLSDGSTTGYSALHHKEKALDAQTAAETAKTDAETAKTAAEAAQTAAEAALADFEGLYLGPHASNPTQDANGDNVGAGDLYFNTTNSELLVYNGTNWVTSGVTTTATTSDNGLMSSSDKSKIDGIETGATADQTAAEIKTAYESNNDTNAFTDADHTKLDGIEASADVTDAANVDPLVDTHLNTGTANSGEYLKWTGTDYDWASVPAGYADSDVDTHLNVSGASANQFLKYNGSDYAWDDVDLSSKLSLTGGTMTGAIRLDDTDIIFDDTSGYSLTLRANSTTTSNKTISLPDKDGEVIVANDGDISLISTSSAFFGPVLEIFHDSTSPADSDKAGSISWKANSSVGTKTSVATLQANSLSVYSSGITGELIFYTQAGAASDARLKINSTEILALENIRLDTGNTLIFEGATADDFETTLTVTDPTADRSISLPDSDGVVGVISSSGYLSDITGVKINNVQINPAFPIAGGTYMTTSSSAATAFQFYGKRTIGHSSTRDSYARIKLISDVTIGSSDKYVDLIGDIFLDGTFHVGDTSSIVFEGATEDGSETTLTVTDPTADRTITMPDASGGVAVFNTAPTSAITDGTSGQFLKTDGAGNLSFDSVPAGYTDTDVDTHINTSTATSGQYLGWNGTDYAWSTVSGYTDADVDTHINTSTATSGQYLGWNGSDYAWSTVATGGDMSWQSSWPDDPSSQNIAIGGSSLGSLTSGTYNVGIGSAAGYSITTGVHNVAIGRQSGYGSTGNYNINIGDQAGNYNTSGKDYQVNIGAQTGNDQYADETTAIGAYAMTDGNHYQSTAVGYNALGNSSTSNPYYNVAVGHNAQDYNYYGDYDVNVGWNSDILYNNVNYSTTIGAESLSPGNYSTVVGYQAGASASGLSDYSTLVGGRAGYDLDGGDYCTFVGYYAGYSGGSQNYNQAFGYRALYSLTTGNYNTGVGTDAGLSLSSGAGNVLLGQGTGSSLTTGTYNVCIGYGTNVVQSGTDHAIAIGMFSKADDYSIAIGENAGASATSGSYYNVMMGRRAGYDLDGGDFNVFIGYYAGYHGGTGNYNHGIGRQALVNLTTGTHNSGIGYQALLNVDSGYENNGLGYRAGRSITTGAKNTVIGHHAGYQQDSSTTNALTTGFNVTCLGNEAMPSSATAMNEITLGDNDITSLRCNVQTISSLSDERDKTAIKTLPYGLDFINDMRPVQFTWNRRDGSLGDTPDIGFIAQDLHDVELTHSSSSRTRLVNWENPEKLEADYVRSYPILVKAVQELSAKVDALTARVAELEGV